MEVESGLVYISPVMFRNAIIVALCVYSVHHMCSCLSPAVLSWLLAGDDGCVGNKCSDIKAELMRQAQGGRLPEQEWSLVRSGHSLFI